MCRAESMLPVSVWCPSYKMDIAPEQVLTSLWLELQAPFWQAVGAQPSLQLQQTTSLTIL